MVDNVVSVFAPAAAARRAHARAVYQRVAERAYDAAKTHRLNSRWNASNRSADLELLSDADKLRARARDLVRNNAYAQGVMRCLLRNVVGEGISPQARTPDEAFNEAAEDLFARWSETADAGGRLTFEEIQALAYSERHEAGEVLIHFVEVKGDPLRPIPLAIELIEADRLATDYWTSLRPINSETGNEIRRGVEIDRQGRPVAYWLYPTHPNDVNTIASRPERHPASEFLHLYKPQRVGQTRGVTTFAPVISWLKSLGFYVENELQASAVASCFTAAIKTMGGASDGGILDTADGEASDGDGNSFEYLQPGLVARLMPGEEIDVINPSRPNAQADAWISLMLRSIAVGTGVSYSRLARDYRGASYSAHRAEDLEDRREFRPEQQWLIRHLCQPVWRRVIDAGVRAGVDGFPSPAEYISRYTEWTKHAWQPPGWEWVDPQNEASASKEALACHLSTYADELGKRGKDYREHFEQVAKEKELLDQLGLAPVVQTQGGAQPTAPERRPAAAKEQGDDEDDGDAERAFSQDQPRGKNGRWVYTGPKDAKAQLGRAKEFLQKAQQGGLTARQVGAFKGHATRALKRAEGAMKAAGMSDAQIKSALSTVTPQRAAKAVAHMTSIKQSKQAKPPTLREKVVHLANNHAGLEAKRQAVLAAADKHRQLIDERDAASRDSTNATRKYLKTRTPEDRLAAQQLVKSYGEKATAVVENLKSLNDQAHAALALDKADRTRIQVTLSKSHPLGDAAKANALDADRFVAARLKTDDGKLAVVHAQIPNDPTARAHWSKGVVWSNPNTSASTQVHEVGHHIENNVPGVKEAVQEFLGHRLEKSGKPDVSLAQQFPQLNYEAHEFGNDDDFGAAFGHGSHRSYYVGKKYTSGDTEVLSMGIEQLHRDPIGFAAADPEFFRFVVGVLDGTIRK